MNTGIPCRAARSRPAGSVRMATAPRATASPLNSAPCARSPASAAYRSPGWTCRESWVTPEIPNVPFGMSKTGVPRSSPSPDNGRAWIRAGRITTREYPVSGRGEPDIWDCRAVWRDLQRLHRELNDLVEDGTGDLIAEVPKLLVWVL